MSDHDRAAWEARWSRVLRDHPDPVTRRPSRHLVAAAGALAPGRALDAGCGHGTETLWLARQGWRVTAVDFAAPALAAGRTAAEAADAQVAERIAWIQADLATWSPPPDGFDLVSCLYVHVATTVADLVGRMAAGVAPGGTLLLAGHRPVDPATGRETAAAGQVQVSVDEALAALDDDRWDVIDAAEHERPAAGTGVDAVVHARRRA